jgi:hypothetical protein
MNSHNNSSNKVIGGLLISGALGLFIPYNILIFTFDYPDILREETSIILTRFHQGGSSLIWTWFAFAITGIPLLPAYILIGEKLKAKSTLVTIATTIGVIGLIVQMIGLLRWTFVVPTLADSIVNATSEASKDAAIVTFKVIHQFAGVLLGEHLGQLFTIIWTVLISITFQRLKLFPAWISFFAYGTSAIYLLAQFELFSTVMRFPSWKLAGFIGSSMWLIWLVMVGVCYLRMTQVLQDTGRMNQV